MQAQNFGSAGKMLEDFRPATFLERGATVPFTTPTLASARVRPTSKEALEVLVDSPGGRGVYVLDWNGIGALCRPTVHDAQLIAAVSELKLVTPATIREAARAVAAEGLAGRAAMHAAEAARQSDESARLVTNYNLLLRVISQLEPRGDGWRPPETDAPANVEIRANRAVALLAPSIGFTADQVASALEQLAAHFCAIGIASHQHKARLPQAVLELESVRGALRLIAEQNAAAGDATLIANSADISITCAASTLATAGALVNGMADLLRQWLSDPAAIQRMLALPEWLLDGWGRICAIWREATATGTQLTALGEMLQLLPVTPQEAAAMAELQNDILWETQRRRRRIQLYEDWRTGQVMLDQVARNEVVLANAA